MKLPSKILFLFVHISLISYPCKNIFYKIKILLKIKFYVLKYFDLISFHVASLFNNLILSHATILLLHIWACIYDMLICSNEKIIIKDIPSFLDA